MPQRKKPRPELYVNKCSSEHVLAVQFDENAPLEEWPENVRLFDLLGDGSIGPLPLDDSRSIRVPGIYTEKATYRIRHGDWILYTTHDVWATDPDTFESIYIKHQLAIKPLTQTQQENPNG
jgi:hypothetical protein